MLLCQPNIHCQVFEDKKGALELARTQKFRPCTEHSNVIYWHFVDHVQHQTKEIMHIDTKDQLADIFTKRLPNCKKYCFQGAD